VREGEGWEGVGGQVREHQDGRFWRGKMDGRPAFVRLFPRVAALLQPSVGVGTFAEYGRIYTAYARPH
jgi:hypothetical protein